MNAPVSSTFQTSIAAGVGVVAPGGDKPGYLFGIIPMDFAAAGAFALTAVSPLAKPIMAGVPFFSSKGKKYWDSIIQSCGEAFVNNRVSLAPADNSSAPTQTASIGYDSGLSGMQVQAPVIGPRDDGFGIV
jgi:hypothetical protein